MRLREQSSPYNEPSSSRSNAVATEVELETVRCLFDYQSTDPDHLSFKKNDLLTIVHKETTGWWAAKVPGDERIGWVPEAYVQLISTAMTEKMQILRHQLLQDSRSSDVAYTSPHSGRTITPPHTTTESSLDPLSSPEPSSSGFTHNARLASQDLGFDVDAAIDGELPQYKEQDDVVLPTELRDEFNRQSADYSPTPSEAELPPPSPIEVAPPTFASSSRSRKRNVVVRPLPANLPTYGASQSSTGSSSPRLSGITSLSSNISPHYDSPRHILGSLGEGRANGSISGSSRSGPWSDITSSDVDIGTSRDGQFELLNLAWYLRTEHSPSEIRVNEDGAIVAGTVPALLERLLVETPTPAVEKRYRQTFLTTFKSFTVANDVFEGLKRLYEAERPAGITDDEYLIWKNRRLLPMQIRVLSVISDWVDNHGLHIDDPQLVPRVRDFLCNIASPSSLVLTARSILQAIERQFNAEVNPAPVITSSSAFYMLRKSKTPKADFLKWDPTEVAGHLTLMESRAYNRIRPHECLNSVKTKGPAVANLNTFCEMSDRVSAWVKHSILTQESLGKRADTISLWIKIAERCRSLNNIFSTSAIIAALSSSDVGKLVLTWAHVSRRSHMDTLAKITDPTGNFSSYRSFHANFDGSCVPFITMFLTDLVHINDRYRDSFAIPADPNLPSSQPYLLINFAKLQRLSDVVGTILKFHGKNYKTLSENSALTTVIDQHIALAAAKDPGFFWQRSQELQQAEATHADIWKNLNDAGF